MGEPSDPTGLLVGVSSGDREAENRLTPLVYANLRALAAKMMRRERADHTLQPTALVHEAYLKLIDQTRVTWKNRAHFFAVAAQAMRRILIDHARKRAEVKRGGRQSRLAFDEQLVAEYQRSVDLVALSEALDRLAMRDPLLVRIVELRFFAGLTVAEAAEVLGMSSSTVEREWRCARVWLRAVLSNEEDAGT